MGDPGMPNDPSGDTLSWDRLTWQDIQAIGMALAERHAADNILTLPPERLVQLVEDLPGFTAGGREPDDFTLSAIVTAWIDAQEGGDDRSPFEFLA